MVSFGYFIVLKCVEYEFVMACSFAHNYLYFLGRRRPWERHVFLASHACTVLVLGAWGPEWDFSIKLMLSCPLSRPLIVYGVAGKLFGLYVWYLGVVWAQLA